jgi:alpha-beta hydrolase superfamily lysophospholipase
MGFFSSFFSKFFSILLGKRSLTIIFGLLLILSFLILMGPLFPADPYDRFQIRPKISKAAVIEGTEEYYLPSQDEHLSAKKFAFTYIHGFSSSRQEISPVVEDLAKFYAAPAYFVRLTGHGLDDHGASLGEAQCLDWMNDTDRAVSNGKVEGRDLIVVGTSFGGLLASFAALEHAEKIKALILLSPLFDTFDPRTKFLTGPFGKFWAKLAIGEYREYKTLSDIHRKIATSRYPSRVIPELMKCVNYIRGADFSKIKIPLLLFYTEQDDVVSVSAIKKRFQEFGSSRKLLVPVPNAGHVLTGQIFEPQTIPFVEDEIQKFLQTL